MAAFMEAQIRDQYLQASPQLPAGQLRQTRPATPHLARPRIQPAGLHRPDLHRPARPGIRLASTIKT